MIDGYACVSTLYAERYGVKKGVDEGGKAVDTWRTVRDGNGG